MKKKVTEFEQFICWFSNLEEVSLQARHDFLAHITEVGYIDEKATEFIENTLGNLEELSQKRQSEWQKYAQIMKNGHAIETNKSYSMRQRMAQNINVWMKEKSTWLKSKFKQKESKAIKVAESAEDIENAANIARLKASLG